MNPARSLGPAVAALEFDSIWVYLLAPLLGGTLGAVVYQLIRQEEAVSEEPPSRDAFTSPRLLP
jgi:aquaporin NIP